MTRTSRSRRRLSGLALLCFVPLLIAARPHQERQVGQVRELRLAPHENGAELLIVAEGAEVRWSDFSLGAPPRVVVDLQGFRNALPADRFGGVERGGIRELRASQFSPGVVRVVVDLERESPYVVERVPEGIRVRFSGGDVAFQPWTSSAVERQRAERTQRETVLAQQQPPITVTFQDADIRDVLASFAEFTGRSIVAGTDVTGSVSATIRNQPWDVALQSILRAYGLAAQELPSGIIQVDAIEKLKERQTAEPLVTRTFRINYVPVQELTATLESLLTERGKIAANPSTNTLVVTDVEAVINDLRRMVGELDVRTPQVSIEAKIIFVNRTDVEELGITYDLKDSQGNTLNRLTSVPDPLNPGELTNENLVLLGGNSIAALGNANVRVQGPQLETVISLVLGRFTLVGFIDALQSAELSDVQAAPLITTLDNQEAEIWVGERTPIRVVDVGGAGGAVGGGVNVAAPRATAQLVETGIRLRVTPHITADRRILMQLHAERSSAQLAATDIGVIFQQQQGTTRLMVADGETAVIGGLTVTEVAQTRAGIPFLMDLPVVGRLFRTDRTREQKRDLLIMVTPHIVDDRA
jgi:type IV pilus assembly protein PilQ